MWNLNDGANELTYKIEIGSQMWKTNLQLPRGKREMDKLGDWD